MKEYLRTLSVDPRVCESARADLVAASRVIGDEDIDHVLYQLAHASHRTYGRRVAELIMGARKAQARHKAGACPCRKPKPDPGPVPNPDFPALK